MRDDDNKKQTDIIGWEERLVEHVKYEWDKGYQYVESLNSMYDDLYKMLRGERAQKNYDWQSNLSINKTFQIVWTIIPYAIQKIFGASPIVGVGKKGDRQAEDRENLLEFWHTLQPSTSGRHIPFKLIVISWWLRALLNGVGIMKKSWHQTLKRKSRKISMNIPTGIGEDGNIASEPHETTVTQTIPVEDWPINEVVNNRDIVVDWLLQPGQSIRQGRFVIHRFVTDLDDLQTSRINYVNLDEINVDKNRTDTQIQQDHAQLKSKDHQETAPDSDIYADIECYERVGNFPVYKEKKNGKWIPCFSKEDAYSDKVTFKNMILTTVPEHNVYIRFEPNRYDEISYIDFHLHLDPERWQSMGSVEPVKDLSVALDDNINAAFDQIWQNLFPPVVVNKYALWDWDTMIHAPHQRWLVGGDPAGAIEWKQPTNITTDSWQAHSLINSEIDLTSSVTPPMQGLGKEKAATTNIMNAQMSAGKLDFLIAMFELTGLIPSCQMDVRFAKKFAHSATFKKILGRDFNYLDDNEEVYRYTPAASSVKLEHQKQIEIQEDTQLLQIIQNVPNPNTAKVMNMILGNILRNRGWDKAAELFDESYYEPSSEAGNVQMLNRMAGATSNDTGIEMSQQEKQTRNMGMNSPIRLQ